MLTGVPFDSRQLGKRMAWFEAPLRLLTTGARMLEMYVHLCECALFALSWLRCKEYVMYLERPAAPLCRNDDKLNPARVARGHVCWDLVQSQGYCCVQGNAAAASFGAEKVTPGIRDTTSRHSRHIMLTIMMAVAGKGQASNFQVLPRQDVSYDQAR